VEFEVLGPVRALRGGEVVALGGAMRQGLLGLLLARANEPVAVDVLVEALWGGEPDERHVPRLHMHISKLRKALGVPDRLTFDAGAYSLTVLSDELDSHRFDSLVGEATSISGSNPQRGVEVLRTAVGLWRGDAFQGLDLVDLHGPVQQLTERRVVAYEQLMAGELACGRHARVVAELPDLVRQHPFRERLHALLVTALYRGGRQADALAAYRAARQTLVDELGLEPGPELRAIEQQILAGDPIDLGRSDSAGGTHRDVVPAQLPPEARIFVGRAAEIAALNRLAEANGSVMVVSALAGTAGVGKTALAVRWAHQMRDQFDDGQLYVDLRGYGPNDPVTPEEALAGFLRSLGVDGAAIPSELADRSARFRSIVDGRRMLIVLDNARSAEQVRPMLPGTPSCFVLITSRDALAGLVTREGARRIDLDLLSDDEAARLVREVVGDGVGRDRAGIAALAESCARLPLALRIAAERVKTVGSVAEVVADLSDERARLDLLDAGGDSQTAVRAVFSWSYRQLPPEAARLFRLSGLHPGSDWDFRALAALAGETDMRAARRYVDALIRAHMLERSAGRFHAHDLLRAYAAELIEDLDGGEEYRLACRRLFDYYVPTAAWATDVVYPHEQRRHPELPRPDSRVDVTPSLTPDQASVWLDAELPNLLAIAGLASKECAHEYTVALSEVLRRHLRVRGSDAGAESIHRAAVAAAQALGDRDGEALALCALGETQRIRGEYDLAIDHLSSAADIATSTGQLAAQADALVGLGHVDRAAGRNVAARERLQHALELAETVNDRTLQLNALRGLGLVHLLQGEFESSFECCQRVLDIARVLGDRVGELGALGDMGAVHLRLGRYDAAVESYQQSLWLARAARDKTGEMNAHLGLAQVYASIEQSDLASVAYRQAAEIAGEINDVTGELSALLGLGNGARMREQFSSAAAYLQQVLDTAQRIGSRNWQFEAHDGIGRLHHARGEAENALNHHQQALELADELGQPEDQVRAHDGLARAYQAIGQSEHARRHWREAMSNLNALGTAYTEDPQVNDATIRAHLHALDGAVGDPGGRT
jgi:DNA-binding SARP family transcriptional activator/tetratricopeptide (TPR) repeat protein